MFKTRTFWAIVLAIITSILVLETKLNFSGNALWLRAASVLSTPGARVVAALDSPGSALQGWARFWQTTALVCNFLVYAIFWYVCVWLVGYFRSRRHPYDRQPTMLYH